MNQKQATYIIAALVVAQIILAILIYTQFPFIEYENQRNAGIMIAISLFLLATILHIYEKTFRVGEDKVVERETEG